MNYTTNYTTFNKDGTIKNIEPYTVRVKEGDRVHFIDNSILADCPANHTPNRSNRRPAGMQGERGINGTVLRTDSVQTADDFNFWNRSVEMPIVVLGDDDSVIYCHPINIRKV